jgi:RimJ/RimL family protein N-acetyltransferase
MQRVEFAPSFATRMPELKTGVWLARRWYYTPKTRRAYSVRQMSPGDRRLLAQFIVELGSAATDRDQSSLKDLTSMLFDRVIVGGGEGAVALENTPGGDRVIGVCLYAPTGHEGADFSIAVAPSFRGEQVGRTLLESVVRHAKRVGVRRLTAETAWSNRAMHSLATSMGFQVLPLQRDRTLRLLVLDLK